MKRLVICLISSCVMLFASAQEEIVLDSLRVHPKDVNIRQPILSRAALFDDSFSLNAINLVDQSMFHQPLQPDYNKNLDFSKYLNSSFISSESISVYGFGPSPFYTSGAISNQAAYRLNDRLSIGGNSFGAQSVFDQPRLNSSMQNMSTKGASMFMQYKVSKNFKVQTRVSISNHGSLWEP